MLRFMAKVVVVLFKVLLTLFVIMVPLLGVWFASSLAAYYHGPTWLVVTCGLLFFPIVPLLWEAWGTRRYRRKKASKQRRSLTSRPSAELRAQASRELGADPDRILTFWDRMILRTLVLNLSLLVALGWLFPEEGFTALSARGDWMVEALDHGWAEPASRVLLRSAEGLEFLYRASHTNPYEEFVDERLEAPDIEDRGEIRRTDEEDEPEDFEVDDGQRPPMSWPPPGELHPLVVAMPAEVETSIESVANYIAEHEDDPYYRIKALFDYVVDRIEYDVAVLDALRRGESYYPPQDAESIFLARVGVYAGYANLLVELGKYTGDEIVYITGNSREQDGAIAGIGHAWNAARINDRWYLVEPTWAAGHIDSEKGYVKTYDSTYLFTPPEVMINTHFPSDSKWQLLKEPLSRSAFVRQPMLRPAFFANGMELIEPTRSQIRVGREAHLRLRNPRGRHMLAYIVPRDGGQTRDCQIDPGVDLSIRCQLPSSGRYLIVFFGSKERYGSMPMWGQIEVHGG